MKTITRIAVDEHLRETRPHGTYAFPLQTYLDDLDRYDIGKVAWHWHEEIEFGVMLRGAARLSVTEQHFSLKPGQGFFVNANVPHTVEPLGTGTVFSSLVLSPRLLAGHIGSVLGQKYVLPLLECTALKALRFDGGQGWHAPVLAGLRHILALCEQGGPGYELRVAAALHSLWAELYGGCAGQLGPTGGAPPPKDDTRIKQMLDYVHTHYAEAIALADIAAAANLSVSECCRCFKRALGCTPFAFLAGHRLAVAAGLLGQGVPVGQVYGRVGFGSQSYFGKRFRAQYGCAPGQYGRAQNHS